MDLRSGEGNGFAPLRGGEVGNVNGFVALDYIMRDFWDWMSQKMCHLKRNVIFLPAFIFVFCLLSNK